MSVNKDLVSRQGVAKRSASPRRYRKCFGEITYGNHIVFSIDGQETFKFIYDAVDRAQTSLYIAGYDLDPTLNFIREDDRNSGNVPRGISVNGKDFHLYNTRSSESNRGNVLEWDESTEQQDHRTALPISGSTKDNQIFPPSISKFTNSAQNRSARQSHRPLQEIIIQKARQGVLVRIIVWQPRLPLRILPGADERGLDGRANEVEVLNELARKYKIEQNLVVKIDNTSPTLSSAHHEKIIVIDNKIGFCGGFDLSRGKWDTSKHEYNDPRRDQDSEPWHDVHAMVAGPVVWDLTYHFNQRWAYHEIKDEKKVRALNLKPPAIPNRSTPGNTRIVALRTWEGIDRDGGILAWYADTIRRAKDSIYIENQFPFQNEFITRILCRRLNEQKSLRVIVVGPMEPNLPGLVGSILSRTSVNDVNKHLQLLRNAGDKGRGVGTFSLVSQDQTTKKLRQIYVHSKVMIVDDKWITIGSANTDKNGFKDSTEVNFGITSMPLAKELRMRLWYEHLGWLENNETMNNHPIRCNMGKQENHHPRRKPCYLQTVITLTSKVLMLDLTFGIRLQITTV
jgi:phosphatidylserine/phosphatidylglycerophosphate/cardiolipin synthase-like enzyme